MNQDDLIILRYKLFCIKEKSPEAYNELMSKVTQKAAKAVPELDEDILMLNDIRMLGRAGALQVLFALGLAFEEVEARGILEAEPS